MKRFCSREPGGISNRKSPRGACVHPKQNHERGIKNEMDMNARVPGVPNLYLSVFGKADPVRTASRASNGVPPV